MTNARWRGVCAIVSGQPDAHRSSRSHGRASTRRAPLIDRLTTSGTGRCCCCCCYCLSRQMPSTSTASLDGCAHGRRARSTIRSQHEQAQTRARGCRYARSSRIRVSRLISSACSNRLTHFLPMHLCLALPVDSTAVFSPRDQLGISEIRQLQHGRTDAIASRGSCTPSSTRLRSSHLLRAPAAVLLFFALAAPLQPHSHCFTTARRRDIAATPIVKTVSPLASHFSVAKTF